MYDQAELEEVAAMPLAKLCSIVEFSPLNQVMETLTKLSQCEERKMKSALREKTPFQQNIAFYAAGRISELGGTYKILEFLNEHGLPLNDIDAFKQSALFYAARELHEDGCQFLLDKRCLINQRDKNGQTCLYYEVNENLKKNILRRGKRANDYHRRINVVELLCQKGVDVTNIDTRGLTVSDFTSDAAVKKAFASQTDGGQGQGKRRKITQANEQYGQDESSLVSMTATKYQHEQLAQMGAKISVRFLSGDEACSFNRSVTPTEIRVAVANKLDKFAPQVKIYGFSTGDLVSSDVKPDAVPPTSLAVVDPSFAFSEVDWKEAIKLHGEAADIDGVRRVIAAVNASSEATVGGLFLCTEVFAKEIGTKMTPCLETLLQVGVDGHQDVEGGQSVLNVACRYGSLELVTLLLTEGAKVRHRNHNGESSLMCASQNLDSGIKIVEALLKAGSNVNDESKNGNTILLLACRKGSIDMVKQLLAAGADVHHRNHDGRSSLICATFGDWENRDSNIKIVEALLKAGSKVNDEDNCGETSLLFACRYGNIDMVETLLAAGADVHHRNHCGSSSLMRASKRDWENRDSGIKIVEALLNAGSKVNDEDNYGETSLHFACRYENGKLVEKLLAEGADVHHRNHTGLSSLMDASTRDWKNPDSGIKIVEALLKAGSKVNDEDNYGETRN